jgi:MurNAc alpha-1-phosphate uridylyltransferase
MPEVAMVFAAGFGKRMLPITNTIPKPLVKVGGKTLLDHSLDQLAAAGVKKAVVNSHYLADTLEKHLRARAGEPEIIVSHEDVILETGGGIVKALPLLGSEPFFSINSDIMLVNGKTPALARLADFWDADKMDVLMMLHPVGKAVGYEGQGDFDIGSDGRILKLEKPSHPYVFTGVMILKPEIFVGLEEKSFSVYRDFIHKKYIQKDGSLSKVYGLVHDGAWLHIGTPEGVELAESAFSGVKG